MTVIRPTNVFVSLLAGATLAAGLGASALAAEATAEAKTAAAIARTEQLLSANDTVLADVRVVGRRTRATDQALRLSTTRASSCAFNPRDDMGRYYDAIGYSGVAGTSIYGSRFGRNPFIGDYGYDYFSETSPFGDASTGFYRGMGGMGVMADGCFAADYAFAAGRAYIARRDKTVAAGFAAYEAGDYATAQAMFEKANKKLGGSTPALMLARVLIERNGDPADATLAIKHLKYASGAPYSPRPAAPSSRLRVDPTDPYGNIPASGEAAAILAKMYFVGYGVEADAEAAVKWFRIALQQGHIPAAKIIGDIYYHGYGVERDVAEAERFYRIAAERGFAPAQVALGDLYYYGDVGGGPNVTEALGWYAQASSSRDPGALYALAHAYDAGEGVPRDAEKALGYYKAAALSGDARARGALGHYFYRGEIVERDPVVARKWFAVAAAGGEADAMFNLAAMMARGEGGDTDRARAWALMKVADAKGHPTADDGLVALEARMSPAEREAGEALLASNALN